MKRKHTTDPAFEVMSKRRKGLPSETNVRRGRRIVRGDQQLSGKVGGGIVTGAAATLAALALCRD